MSFIFLLGAGVHVDAGIPSVRDISNQLCKQVPVYSKVHALFKKNIPLAQNSSDRYDLDNFEDLFRWVYHASKVFEEPFRDLFAPRITDEEIKAISDFKLEIGTRIRKFLAADNSPNANYLASFRRFFEYQNPLRIFTLNLDCCLEDTCRQVGIPVVTGFDSAPSRLWRPCIFNETKEGILLYKLHGSLRWARELIDGSARQYKLREGNFNSDSRGLASFEWILGPNKPYPLGTSDPYLTLLYEFKCALSQAKACVVIGYGLGDHHINEFLSDALDANPDFRLLVVDPDNNHRALNDYICEANDGRVEHLPKKAKEALEKNLILEKLKEMSIIPA